MNHCIPVMADLSCCSIVTCHGWKSTGLTNKNNYAGPLCVPENGGQGADFASQVLFHM